LERAKGIRLPPRTATRRVWEFMLLSLPLDPREGMQ
jgi:hypothetical protein